MDTLMLKRDVQWMRMRTQLAALKLELYGMTSSRGSTYAAVKRDYGFRGNKKRVYDQLLELVEQTRPR